MTEKEFFSKLLCYTNSNQPLKIVCCIQMEINEILFINFFSNISHILKLKKKFHCIKYSKNLKILNKENT